MPVPAFTFRRLPALLAAGLAMVLTGCSGDFSSAITDKEWSSGEIATLIDKGERHKKLERNLFQTVSDLSPGEKTVLGLALTKRHARDLKEMMRGITLLNEACNEGNDRGCAEAARLILVSDDRAIGPAILMLERACERGTMTGCFVLAATYADGRQVEPDPELAVHYAGLACADPSELSCPYSGRAIAELDPEASKALLVASCNTGLDMACFNLALGYEEELYGDEAKAVTLARFEALCRDGYRYGCSRVVWFHDEGLALSADIERALRVTAKSCKRLRSTAACMQLLRYYYDSADGTPRDMERYVDYATLLCRRGSDDACRWMGEAYGTHITEAGLKQRTLGLLREFCKQNRPVTCQRVAEIETAATATKTSASREQAVTDKACQLGDGQACRMLGWAFAIGEDGHDKDIQRAQRMFMLGCEHGNASSCVDRGSLYEYGLHGMQTNLAEAAKMYERACEMGNVLACEQYAQASAAMN